VCRACLRHGCPNRCAWRGGPNKRRITLPRTCSRRRAGAPQPADGRRCGGKPFRVLRRDEGKFGSLFDVPSKFLTLVVPAYNEEKRMGVMLDEMMATLAQMEKSRRCVQFLPPSCERIVVSFVPFLCHDTHAAPSPTRSLLLTMVARTRPAKWRKATSTNSGMTRFACATCSRTAARAALFARLAGISLKHCCLRVAV
jgi:hypothetical protein